MKLLVPLAIVLLALSVPASADKLACSIKASKGATDLKKMAKISMGAAQKAALAKQAGTVSKSELEVEVEGTLGVVSGICPTLSSNVGTTKFTTSAATKFEGASCSAFKAGDRVELKGTKKADGSVAAT